MVDYNISDQSFLFVRRPFLKKWLFWTKFFQPQWTVLVQRRRSSGLNKTVQASECERFKRLKSDGPRKCTVLKTKCGRLENKQLDSLKEVKCTVVSNDSRRFKRLLVRMHLGFSCI